MIKKLFILGVVLSFTVSSVYAAEKVYVSGKGTKYHQVHCRWIKDKEVRELDKDVAIAEGFVPCKVCSKDDLLLEEGVMDEGNDGME